MGCQIDISMWVLIKNLNKRYDWLNNCVVYFEEQEISVDVDCSDRLYEWKRWVKIEINL